MIHYKRVAHKKVAYLNRDDFHESEENSFLNHWLLNHTSLYNFIRVMINRIFTKARAANNTEKRNIMVILSAHFLCHKCSMVLGITTFSSSTEYQGAQHLALELLVLL